MFSSPYTFNTSNYLSIIIIIFVAQCQVTHGSLVLPFFILFLFPNEAYTNHGKSTLSIRRLRYCDEGGALNISMHNNDDTAVGNKRWTVVTDVAMPNTNTTGKRSRQLLQRSQTFIWIKRIIQSTCKQRSYLCSLDHSIFHSIHLPTNWQREKLLTVL